MEKNRRSFLALLAMVACTPVAVMAAATPKKKATGSYFRMLEPVFSKDGRGTVEPKVYEFPTYVDLEDAFRAEHKDFAVSVFVTHDDGTIHTHSRQYVRSAEWYWIDGIAYTGIHVKDMTVYQRDEDDAFRDLAGFELTAIEFKPGRGMITSIYHTDEAAFFPIDRLDLSDEADQTIESWYEDNGWHHFVQVRKDGVMTTYWDGKKVTHLPESYVSWGKDGKPAIFVETVHGDFREIDLRNAQPGAALKVTTPTGNLIMRNARLEMVS